MNFSQGQVSMDLQKVSFGFIVAFLVLVAVAILALLGRPPGGTEVALGLGALAIARMT